jgi:GTP-binding protein YchF
MKIALFGLPQTGKSTVFGLLTKVKPAEIKYDQTGSPVPRVGMVSVPDSRLEFLASVFKPRKVVHAQIEYTDIVGLKFGDVKENRLLAYLRQSDVLAHIVRAFENEAVFHSSGAIDPIRDAQKMEQEIQLSDLILIEGRLERLKKSVMRSKSAEDEMQLAILERIKPFLEEGKPLREAELKSEEDKCIRSFGFLSLKPLQVIVNIGEGQIAAAENLVNDTMKQFLSKKKVSVSYICAPIEAEIAEMSKDDASVFMADYGLKDLGYERLIQNSYDLLGLISFLTVGEDECRAWPVPRGVKSNEAAGQIHTDIQRGFIAAQVIKYEEFKNMPDINSLKQKGLVHIEGRDYIVQDGDIIEYRFNV